MVSAGEAVAQGKRQRRKARSEARKPHVVVAFIAAYLAIAGGRLALRIDPDWYDALAKPPWALPSAVQEGAWFVMFGLLAYSSVVMFRDEAGTKTAHAVFGLRLVHWALLQGMVVLLFALHALLPAAVAASLLVLTGAAISLTALRRNRLVAALTGAYAVWLAFDATVVWALWALNR